MKIYLSSRTAEKQHNFGKGNTQTQQHHSAELFSSRSVDDASTFALDKFKASYSSNDGWGEHNVVVSEVSVSDLQKLIEATRMM